MRKINTILLLSFFLLFSLNMSAQSVEKKSVAKSSSAFVVSNQICLTDVKKMEENLNSGETLDIHEKRFLNMTEDAKRYILNSPKFNVIKEEK